MSARIVCPATRKNGPVLPPRIQRDAKPAKFGAVAQPTAQRQSVMLAARYADLRPMIVLIGSHISPDRAWATKTPALTVVMVVTGISKSEATSMVAGIMAVLQNVMGRGIQQTTKRVTHFRHEGMEATSSSIGLTGGSGESSGIATVSSGFGLLIAKV